MNEEDILADFPEEEEWEAFADDDILADEPTPKHHLYFYTKNVAKAYSHPCHI
jgi:hypothetical protein